MKDMSSILFEENEWQNQKISKLLAFFGSPSMGDQKQYDSPGETRWVKKTNALKLESGSIFYFYIILSNRHMNF